jgi:hypothetical protein
VKSDTALPSDPARAKLLANKILDVSTEKPTEVGSTSTLAALISGKVYRFAPNPLNVKSLSLVLTNPQPHYDMEIYVTDAIESDPKITDPIGLDGLYLKGELNHIFSGRFEGAPRVNAVKGSWQGDHTFVIHRQVLGLGEPAELWNLTFDGEKVNVRVTFPDRPEISVDGKTGA